MIELLQAAQRKRVLFIGETIIDEYRYVTPLGRPLKETIVSVLHQSVEEFRGGVVAAARHAEAFCSNVDIFTDGDAVRKIRYVEQSHVRKLFEVYVQGQTKELEPPEMGSYDVVVVTDYGHGLMTERLIEHVCHEARYLAVNVQTNSGNYGYNLATKYPGADYLCVDEPEARLATQNRTGPIEKSLEALSEIAGKVVVTLGKYGAVGFDRTKMVRVPAYTERVVDTLGAGDAFFAVSALVAEEAEIGQLLALGNAAGALKTGIVGHRESISAHGLVELLERSRS